MRGIVSETKWDIWRVEKITTDVRVWSVLVVIYLLFQCLLSDFKVYVHFLLFFFSSVVDQQVLFVFFLQLIPKSRKPMIEIIAEVLIGYKINKRSYPYAPVASFFWISLFVFCETQKLSLWENNKNKIFSCV